MEDDEHDGSAALSTSQTLVDPTNIIAKPAYDAAPIERVPLQGWKVTLLAMPATVAQH